MWHAKKVTSFPKGATNAMSLRYLMQTLKDFAKNSDIGSIRSTPLIPSHAQGLAPVWNLVINCAAGIKQAQIKTSRLFNPLTSQFITYFKDV